MKVSRNWLQTYFDTPLPEADVLERLFTFHAFEVEGVESVHGDSVLDVKVLPDRAHYALSHKGIAKEVSALTGAPLKAHRIPPGPQATLTHSPSVSIEAPTFCRRYMARYAEIPQVADSNPHARVMLSAIGQRAINAVVDATNITMFDCGQPLHIFDADKVRGGMVVRHARKGEKITLLDSVAGQDRVVELLETDHVIADDNGPIAIAGVKGGKDSGVTSTTRRIIIESANFEPSAVRRTATRLNLRSESSKRYENEITPEMTVEGMDSVSGLIAHNIEGTAFGPVVDVYPTKVSKTVIGFDPAVLISRLGVSVPGGEAIAILTRLGIEVKEDGVLWNLTVPYERLDLTSSIDIVEEVGRIYGYDKVPSVLPPALADRVVMDKEFYWTERIKSILFEQGFSETQMYSLVSKGDVEITYPLANDKKALRKTLLTPELRDTVARNLLNADFLGIEVIKIFEIGRVFSQDGETTKLFLGHIPVRKKKGVTATNLLTVTLDILGRELGIKIEANIPDDSGNLAEVDFNSLISKLPEPGSLADAGFKILTGKKYTPYSRYPFITRDIALFVPSATTENEVCSVIAQSLSEVAGDLLVKGPDCFDRFQKEKEGRASFAFRMIFQAYNRTLSDDEVNGWMLKVYDAVRARGWEVR